MSCIFCRIINGEIPSAILFEDDEIIVISDIKPQAKYHFLIIPKEHYASLSDADEKQLEVIKRIFEKLNTCLRGILYLENGYRLIINQGERSGQTVFHLHLHILVEPD